MTDSENIMGQRLKALREGMGVSQVDFSDMLGIRVRKLRSIEYGDRKMQSSDIELFGEVFPDYLSYLITGKWSTADGGTVENLPQIDWEEIRKMMLKIENTPEAERKIYEPVESSETKPNLADLEALLSVHETKVEALKAEIKYLKLTQNPSKG